MAGISVGRQISPASCGIVLTARTLVVDGLTGRKHAARGYPRTSCSRGSRSLRVYPGQHGLSADSRAARKVGRRAFQSEPFWIASRASAYTINLELPDTRVPTLDHAVDFPDRHFVQRSVRHFGHVIAQHTSDIGPWCEDASVEHILRGGMGTFRASPGPGYSIRIEARRWTSRADETTIEPPDRRTDHR